MRTIVITGATSGIGLATKTMLEKQGDLVIALSRNAEGENSIKCDVSREEDVLNAFNIIKEKYGEIDVLVNNSGFGMSGITELIPMEKIRKLFEVNVLGLIFTCKTFLPIIKRGGKIINIGSAMGLFPLPFRGIYASSKAAVIMFSQCLRMECADFGVHVSCVNPGDIKTNFTKNRAKNFETNERYGKRIETATNKIDSKEEKRMSPEKVAKVIVKLSNKKVPKPMVIVSGKYRVLYFVERIFPKNWFLKVDRKLYGGKYE